MSRKPEGEYKVKVTVSIPMSLMEFVQKYDLIPSEILVAAIRRLIETREKAEAEAAIPEAHKNDQGPHTAEETKDYLKFSESMDPEERKALPLEDKFKMWREARATKANETPHPG